MRAHDTASGEHERAAPLADASIVEPEKSANAVTCNKHEVHHLGGSGLLLHAIASEPQKQLSCRTFRTDLAYTTCFAHTR